MIARSAVAQPLHQRVGHGLDREAHRHDWLQNDTMAPFGTMVYRWQAVADQYR